MQPSRMASATDLQLSRCVHTRPFCPRACLSPSALAYESLRMTCTYARPGLTAAPTAARLQVQDVRVHPQQGPHHLGACRLDRGRIGCGLHPCEWCRPSPPPARHPLTPMASMPPIYQSRWWRGHSPCLSSPATLGWSGLDRLAGHLDVQRCVLRVSNRARTRPNYTCLLYTSDAADD